MLLDLNIQKEEWRKLIHNGSKCHLWFAYVNDIINKTSIDFVTKIFIEPIVNLIKKERIFLDEDFELSFNMISDLIGNQLHKFMIMTFRTNNKKYIKFIEILIKNTWYDEIDKENWTEKMIKMYFPNKEDKEYVYLDDNYDPNFLFILMRSIHLTYYHTHGVSAPLKYEQD